MYKTTKEDVLAALVCMGLGVLTVVLAFRYNFFQ